MSRWAGRIAKRSSVSSAAFRRDQNQEARRASMGVGYDLPMLALRASTPQKAQCGEA